MMIVAETSRMLGTSARHHCDRLRVTSTLVRMAGPL